ncbi:MAG TPA: hypothetical protein VFJ69_16000 [Actinomycetota bacterium]|jgi:hypothetical protein|nr:hypothetical protein [Actinomycetota bacterium]
MATSRTIFQDGPAGDGTPAPASSFVWGSLHDPSADRHGGAPREVSTVPQWGTQAAV